MMWPYDCSLRQSTIAASVVDLPEPVAPTKIAKPRLAMTTSLSTCGTPKPSIVGNTAGITRITIPTLPCWINALTRKRPTPGGLMAKLHSLVRSNSAACLSFMMARANASVWPALSGCGETLVTLPSTFMAGGKSLVINRSLPLRLTISFNKSLMNLLAWSRSMNDSFQKSSPESYREFWLFRVLRPQK